MRTFAGAVLPSTTSAVGDYTFEAVTQGSDLHVSGRSQFKTAELNIDGDVQLRGAWPATVNLHFNHLNVDSVFRDYLKRRVTGRPRLRVTCSYEARCVNPANSRFLETSAISLLTSRISRFATMARSVLSLPTNFSAFNSFI